MDVRRLAFDGQRACLYERGKGAHAEKKTGSRGDVRYVKNAGYTYIRGCAFFIFALCLGVHAVSRGCAYHTHFQK